MKDPDRLTTSGTDEERRLLRAAHPVRVPDTVKDQVRRAVEGRMRPRPARPLLIGAGLLLATAAAALPLWRSLESDPRPSPPPPPSSSRPTITPLEPEPSTTARSTAPEPVPSASASHHRAPPPVPPASPNPAPPTVEGPGLDLPGFLRGAGDPPRPAPAPPPAPPRLVIARSDRRDVSLEATASTVRGTVRGRALDLTVAGQTITGRIGDDRVDLNIFGRVRAEGHAGGLPLLFTFTPIERGWIVNASLPDVGGRVRLEAARLGFHPGCGADLRGVPGRPGVYEGSCADDTRMRVELPAAFLEMPPLARLVILGMLLPEPEAVLRGKDPGLFPPP